MPRARRPLRSLLIAAPIIAPDRPGSNTFADITARSAVTPMLSGSMVGSRTLRLTTREVVLSGPRAGANVRLRVRIAPGAIACACLRVSFVPHPEPLLLPTG